MSSLTSLAVKQSRVRHTTSKPAPTTAAQRKEKAKQREDNQEEINAEVTDWFNETMAKASVLAAKFNKKPRYFLDMFFHGGARMINAVEEVNPYCAFLSLKSQELRDEGHVMSLADIQKEFADEYTALNETERQKISREHKENMSTKRTIRHPLPRSRLQDVANVKRNIINLLSGLKARSGIEAFFCIVRSTPDYHISPQWYFTTEALSEYMKIAARKKWDAHEVGTKLEAFAIAGCDPLNLLNTSKKKADYLKSQIRDKFHSNLVEITSNPEAVMHWTHFEEDVVLRYGIDLVGYTYEKLQNPSEMSTSLAPLRALLTALETGACKFVKLSSEERKRREDALSMKLISGEIQPRKRKQRSDAGGKRSKKRARTTDENGSETEGDKENTPTHYKSSETVQSDEEE